MPLRSRNQALLAKIEGSEGVDAAPVPASDAILIENLQVSYDPKVEQTNEHTGSLDSRGPIPGGMAVKLSFDVYLKGSGSAGVAPEWGVLMQACGWSETLTAAAVPVAAEAAAAGSAHSLTLGTGAAATAQLYRGMPLVLAGNPAAGETSYIADYTASRVAQLASEFSPALDTSTTYQIPANVLYRPVSTGIPSLTFYAYRDGKLLKVIGSRGTGSLQLNSGKAGRIKFQFTGMFLSQSDAPVPASTLVFDSTRPPIWKQGRALVARIRASMASLTLDFGNQMTNPDDPNADEGFNPAIITARTMTGSCDPLEELVGTRDAMSALRSGTSQIIHGSYGSATGNRIGVTIPAATHSNIQPGDRSGLLVEGLQFSCVGEDAGAFIAIH
jgi:hypothetical protein